VLKSQKKKHFTASVNGKIIINLLLQNMVVIGMGEGRGVWPLLAPAPSQNHIELIKKTTHKRQFAMFVLYPNN
jgi:hypothetical protein